MTFRKIIGVLHLWLGFASGLVVFVLGVTGCMLAFEVEIRNATESFRNVAVERKPILPPSKLKQIAETRLLSKKALGVDYPGSGKAAVAAYYNETAYELVFLNPYTGAVLKHKNMTEDFFRIVLDGHYYLWLPHHIGQPIAASATLVFLILMVTGIVLWWPRNKAARKQRFSIKWSARWRRKNYDLHTVLGFYMSWVAIFIAITGLVFGFQWFAKSVYWISSGGNSMVEHKHPLSDVSKYGTHQNITDKLWAHHRPNVGPNESLGIYFATLKTDPVEVVINHRPGTYYNSDFYHYDQFTGAELPTEGSYAGAFKNAAVADKLVRLNYDLHVGAALGLPGKILSFFASLVAASLPITGFIMWRGRRKKSSKKGAAKNITVAQRAAVPV